MRTVYVCAPLGAESAEKIQENIDRAIGYGRWLARNQGCCPVVPHTMALVLNDQDGFHRSMGKAWSLRLLALCDEIWIFGKRSEGMEKEIDYAVAMRKRVCYVSETETIGIFKEAEV